MAEESGLHIVEMVAGEGGRSRYEPALAALEALLVHGAAAEQPVAVVSVAGASRGGKSFMLDYFLRYLRADDGARADGSWLGAPDEPLRGFSWRGGTERDTTGLLLWSRPMRATTAAGEPMTVLLMDTQGTFDQHTPMRDSATIFALSTLISSVQIYNLHQDIQEDSLQHLQLFTAHGRMAMELNNGRTPYQSLKFLVRDWRSPFEYAYGAAGGSALLARRLKVDNGLMELQEVREHILASFETVDCFLMPHPGLPVHERNFDGRHSGVSDDFRQQLIDFVPSVFNPRNLPPKTINGVQVTGRELYTYFRTYVDLFNSADLPEPMSIMRATTEAALLTAIEAARRLYQEAMEASCGARRRGQPPAGVRACHQAARDAALEAFRTRPTLATQHQLREREAELTQALDDRLSEFELINEAKHHSAIADARAAYEGVIESETGNDPLCLNPPDLVDLHRTAAGEAVNLFDSRRITEDGVIDEEKAAFIAVLEIKLSQLTKLNELHNDAAVAEAVENYGTYMDNACGDPPCMRRRDLELNHDDALEFALGLFNSRRNRITGHERDPYKSQLCKDIDEKFTKLQNLNVRSNEAAVQAAITTYNNAMVSVCAPHLPPAGQEHLNENHEEALELALNEFHSRRRAGEEVDENDIYRVRILQALMRRYQEVCEYNEIAAGLAAYCNAMDRTCGAGRPRLSPGALDSAHQYALNLALQIYQQNRQGRLHGNNNNEDRQRINLTLSIQTRYEHYGAVNDQNPEVPPENAVVAALAQGVSASDKLLASMLLGVAVGMTVASGGALGVAAAVGSTEAVAVATGLAATALNFARTHFWS